MAARTGAGLASVVGNTGPFLIIVLAAIFLGEPITGGKIPALVFGMADVMSVAGWQFLLAIDLSTDLARVAGGRYSALSKQRPG